MATDKEHKERKERKEPHLTRQAVAARAKRQRRLGEALRDNLRRRRQQIGGGDEKGDTEA